ncbi:hypothetical protein [Candidatus Formimonas warabiya]|uniref:Phage tail protein n=1 Tax=Formimonas warabiya TaxID=1761012 RepID=A0A3G1KZX4_FORW1|nr:hypothetical protein [Candidatus Formimonas warabiya]ATW27948.1 hypothetical protein DCMF_27190 [Candidatus Formimonas warabiya]
MKLRDKILNVQDIRAEKLEVPEWGVEVLVKALKGSQRAELLQNNINAKTGEMNLKTLYTELVIASTCDPETQEPVFASSDRDTLAEKSGAVLERIAQLAMRLSGLTQNAVDGMAKN